MPVYNVRVKIDGEWGDTEEWDYDVPEDALYDIIVYALDNSEEEWDEIEIVSPDEEDEDENV